MFYNKNNRNVTLFTNDIKKGKIGEQIFEEDFLKFLDIHYENVTGSQAFQIIDTDFKTKIGKYEIKTNYKDNDVIIIEEFTHDDPDPKKCRYGWFYKSKADLLVFISKETRNMILVPFNDAFKKHYESIKNNYRKIKNKVSRNGYHEWQSSFRKIPLEAINGYYSFYKRYNDK